MFSEMKNKTIAVDLAKNVFQIGVSRSPRSCREYRLSRAKFRGSLEPGADHRGVEACGSAHYWGRKIREPGHTVVSDLAAVCDCPASGATTFDRTDVSSLFRSLSRQRYSSRSRSRRFPNSNCPQCIESVRPAMRTRTARINRCGELLRESWSNVIPTGADHLDD